MYGEVCKYTAAIPSRLWHFQCSQEPAGRSKHDKEGRNRSSQLEHPPGQPGTRASLSSAAWAGPPTRQLQTTHFREV